MMPKYKVDDVLVTDTYPGYRYRVLAIDKECYVLASSSGYTQSWYIGSVDKSEKWHLVQNGIQLLLAML